MLLLTFHMHQETRFWSMEARFEIDKPVVLIHFPLKTCGYTSTSGAEQGVSLQHDRQFSICYESTMGGFNRLKCFPEMHRRFEEELQN